MHNPRVSQNLTAPRIYKSKLRDLCFSRVQSALCTTEILGVLDFGLRPSQIGYTEIRFVFNDKLDGKTAKRKLSNRIKNRALSH
jgi:hypothetical protein